MKRFWFTGAVLFLCLLLAGCAGKPTSAPALPDPETEAPQEREVTAALELSEPEPEVPEPEPEISEPEPDTVDAPDDSTLTEDEIVWFNEEFFNQPETARLRNTMLRSEYETAADVDLFQLFYDGASQSPGTAVVTEAERVQLSETDRMALTLDITKVTAAGMDAALMELAGLTLDETNRIGLEHFVYLDEYDAYYFAHGDTNYTICTILSGTRNDNGAVTLYYEHDYGSGHVTLASVEDCYIFVANDFDSL